VFTVTRGQRRQDQQEDGAMRKRTLSRDNLGTVVLFTPGFAIYLGFMILPIILCFYYSFFDWDGIRTTMSFIGLDNFFDAVRDRDFLNSLWITFFFTVPGTIMVNALGICLAVLLNRKSRITNMYRSVFFFPLLISAVAIGFIWKALLTYSGIVNTLLNAIHVESIDFLGDPKLAPWSLLFINVWHDTGFVTVIYLAGLQAIPGDLYDSAKIDGASGWQQFVKITFPWLAPAFTACVAFLFTGYMRLYDMVMVMTSGGPAGATETIALRVIRVGFSQNKLSYGSSLAIYMLIIVGIISVTLTYYLRKREEKLIM
jgi:ABC-type sugar transport system permease subunit